MKYAQQGLGLGLGLGSAHECMKL